MDRKRPNRKCLLRVPLQSQPTETSCGPTCLQAVYAYYGDEVPLKQLMQEVRSLEHGGTFATMLGLHALQRGYSAIIYTYNLRVFDPTWFPARRERLLDKLQQQLRVRHGKRRLAVQSHVDFVERGGEVRFEDLTGALIRRYLRREQPILTGLSATFLYRCPREVPATCEDDDVQGEPLGHFVILSGYDARRRLVLVADPFAANPLSADRCYEVGMDRLLNAILLGVLTHDGDLLMITPKKAA